MIISITNRYGAEKDDSRINIDRELMTFSQYVSTVT